MFQGFDALPEALRPLAHEPRPPQADTRPHSPNETLVDCAVYAEGHRLPGTYSYATALDKVRQIEMLGHEAFVWVGLREPDQAEMQEVAEVFGIHPLAVEDAVCAHQRPKLERFDETLFLVLKTVAYVPHESVAAARQIVETGEVMVFVRKDFVVTVRHGEHGGLSDLRKRMEADPEQLRLGPYAVMHAIAHEVVNHYLVVSHLIESDIDSIEGLAFAPGRKIDVEPIYLLKREVVELRRCVNPLSGAFLRIQQENKDLISKEVRRYLRDLADHHSEAAEHIASYDDMLNSLIQAALARVGMQQNSDMRKISAWAGIIAVPTMFAGIYGMNFEFMPELKWHWGYPVVVAIMITACLTLYFSFRRLNWL
ncbi:MULTISPECIES: magnesium/cobalt transporter CorA [unclassified Mycobacterium]|uniref:magnesium/cobalt transporter CorA n=1 Tax=unclassified Mycobacterium TaxID=2642494 RepID=UPI000800AAAD|nr:MULTISPECIES: magnesium/cobalt transporter CorA [unclassified Mycobacterium]OBH00272.1 magnesium and cobalt transport protein CorA [Mycobacterium sp. E3247]OBI23060.1 magnesium and cobalt transport protein CorA [Mycobacterium sp. E2497]